MGKEVVYVEKKRSTFKTVLIVLAVLAAIGGAIFIAYKLWGDKFKAFKSKVIGKVDLDGDGETDAIMLDTTGNGEIDTIVINGDHE
jgi:hypothetical protein